MGISEDGDGGGPGVDCSVGTIVWVRRRNGSWWPGRILGSDELSASHLMSPRSGTPVKLLGREDASVDWYNLEKSKRVKAFRCGEFDACIERAEASQGIPIKKREKYARREDAILHALELEKKQLELKQQKFGVSSNGMIIKPSVPKREYSNLFPLENYMRNDEPVVHGKFASHKSQTLSKTLALSHGEENMSNAMYVQKGRNGKQFGWEEDIPESIPRMRGLQDFGLRTASSKRKQSPSVAWENSRRHFDNHVDGLPGSGHAFGGANHGIGCKGSLAIKKKRSQGGVIEESLVKKRDRRRPLVQVLQSSAKLPISHSFQFDHDPGIVSVHEEKDHMGVICRAKRSRCVYLPADSNDFLGYPSEQVRVSATQSETDNGLEHTGPLAEEYSSSGLIEADESDSSEGEFSETDTEEEEGNLLGDATQLMIARSNARDSSAFPVSEKFRHMDDDTVPLSSYMPHSNLHEHAVDGSADVGVSKWHMKGKRNIRNLVKRPIDMMDGKISFNSSNKCNGSTMGTTYERKGSSLLGGMDSSCQRASEQGLYHNKKELDYGLGEVDVIDKDLGHKQWTRRYPSVSKAAKDRGRSQISYNDSDNDSHLISPSGWEADGPSRMAQGAYWEDSDECYDPVYAGHRRDQLRTMLVDVDLKVQASYQGEHVPLVSLMSRLNGKAIIGHPVQIEIVEDGSTCQLVSRNDTLPDECAEPPPVWRTARRTAMQRIPRSNPAKSALDGEDAGTLQYSDRESKPPHKKYSSQFNHQARLAKKSISHARRPMSSKLQKQPSKKVSLLSQKTRTLSSIATEQKRGGEIGDAKLVRSGDLLGGLIKPEGAVPLVTCVPVKVAFSRILEAVGRPSSAVAHRVRLASPAVRDPL